MLTTLSTPVLLGLAFKPESQSPRRSSAHTSNEQDSPPRRSRSQSPSTRRSLPELAWFSVESQTSSSSSSSPTPIPSAFRRSILDPETPAFTPLSPPEDRSSSSSKTILTSPNRRKTLELPPSPPDSPPASMEEPLLSFVRPKSKTSRGRAPTPPWSRSRPRAAQTPSTPRQLVSSPVTRATAPIQEEEEGEADEGNEAQLADDDDERFLSLPLLRLRHRLSTSLILSAYTEAGDKKNSITSLPSERSTSPTQRRRRLFPPGTVWAEQSHYRLYALQKSKADRTAGIGYWKRWEGIDLD
ncbi:Ecl1p [Sporobolomyces salmoneus]|uniref:Ecl1p n=1 Tax=Sporobolomyces salmoneus TaxID=183962 RepID=UPI003180D3E3